MAKLLMPQMEVEQALGACIRAGRGRKPTIPAEKIDEIVRLTQESTPEGETHWSCRSMAKAAG